MEVSDSILLSISQFLSVTTIALCSYLKLPQIRRLYVTKSVVGLNFYSLLFELSSYSITACYNYVQGYSLISYLEYPLIIIQEWILIFFYINYSKSKAKYVLLIALYVVGAVLLSLNANTASILEYSLIFCTPASLSSKAIQLFEIWRVKSADSISLMTWSLSAFTNFTRIFTITLESADPVLLANFSLSGSLSLAILLSSYYLKKQKVQ